MNTDEIWVLKPINGIKLNIPYVYNSKNLTTIYNSIINLEFSYNKEYKIKKISENLIAGIEKDSQISIKPDNYKKVNLWIETLHKYFQFKETVHKRQFNKKMDDLLK